MIKFKKILLLGLLASTPILAGCSDDDNEDTVVLSVSTTASEGTEYSGLTMQFGTDADFKPPIVNGTARYSMSLMSAQT